MEFTFSCFQPEQMVALEVAAIELLAGAVMATLTVVAVEVEAMDF